MSLKKLIFMLLAALLTFSGCTKTTNSPGKLIVKVTDDPFNINYVESAT